MFEPAKNAPLTSVHRGKVLREEVWDDGPLYLAEGELADVPEWGRWLDARGCLVLPGIIDFHGDAFERQLMPRPEVRFPPQLALIDTDRQLAANGITTAFHGITLSWEGGLRGTETLRGLMAAFDALRPHCLVDHRIHLRFECHHVEGEAEAVAWMEAGKIGVLAFNDHLPGMRRKPHKWQEWAARAQAGIAEFEARLAGAAARDDEVPALIGRLASAARRLGVPMASHDDHSIEVRNFYRQHGCDIAEFPLHREVAEHAAHQGATVVCGAPNVLRGGSHVGAPRAADLAAEGVCRILASDYYYPAPLHAACRLAATGLLPLDRAWQLISRNPAEALGLSDRGTLAPGKRADFIVVNLDDPESPRLIATVSNGRLVHLTDAGRLHS